MPQDTLGRELDEALRNSPNKKGVRRSGRHSGNALGDMGQAVNSAVRLSISTYVDLQMREYQQLPTETRSNTDLGAFLSASNPDLAALFTNPSTSATDILAQLQNDHPDAFKPQGQPISPIEPFRPHSAHSHRSSVSVSEYSFATTEMDTDDADCLEIEPPNPNTMPSAPAVDVAALTSTGMSWDMRDMEMDGDVSMTRPIKSGRASTGRKSTAAATRRSSSPMSGVIRGPGNDPDDARMKRLERESAIAWFSHPHHALPIPPTRLLYPNLRSPREHAGKVFDILTTPNSSETQR